MSQSEEKMKTPRLTGPPCPAVFESVWTYALLPGAVNTHFVAVVVLSSACVATRHTEAPVPTMMGGRSWGSPGPGGICWPLLQPLVHNPSAPHATATVAPTRNL